MTGKSKKAPAADEQTLAPADVVQRVGQLVRTLRQSMRDLGLSQQIEQVTQAIPDARERLNYVVQMTEKAAERSLNAIDRAQPLQDTLGSDAKLLSSRWDAWFENPIELGDAKDLVTVTRGYLAQVPETTSKINAELLEITMAQDFQDLTGQVIKKMIGVIQEIEAGLLGVLLDSVPGGREHEDVLQRVAPPKPAEEDGTKVHGPQIDPTAEGVLSSQDEVDDLLDELGF